MIMRLSAIVNSSTRVGPEARDARDEIPALHRSGPVLLRRVRSRQNPRAAVQSQREIVFAVQSEPQEGAARRSERCFSSDRTPRERLSSCAGLTAGLYAARRRQPGDHAETSKARLRRGADEPVPGVKTKALEGLLRSLSWGMSPAVPKVWQTVRLCAALDYVQGWYAGDAAQMKPAVYPELPTTLR